MVIIKATTSTTVSQASTTIRTISGGSLSTGDEDDVGGPESSERLLRVDLEEVSAYSSSDGSRPRSVRLLRPRALCHSTIAHLAVQHICRFGYLCSKMVLHSNIVRCGSFIGHGITFARVDCGLEGGKEESVSPSGVGSYWLGRRSNGIVTSPRICGRQSKRLRPTLSNKGTTPHPDVTDKRALLFMHLLLKMSLPYSAPCMPFLLCLFYDGGPELNICAAGSGDLLCGVAGHRLGEQVQHLPVDGGYMYRTGKQRIWMHMPIPPNHGDKLKKHM